MSKWDRVHENAKVPLPYGERTTYYMGAAYLGNLQSVEDWGCGLGYFATILPDPSRCVGIDGSHSPFADRIEDLRTYRPAVAPEGIFMRHVLEHNEQWRDILANALLIFQKRMVLVLFTPYSEATHIMAWTEIAPGITIPDHSFERAELVHLLGPLRVRDETLATKTQYGVEHVYYLSKEHF
jgi:hypothetical protein